MNIDDTVFKCYSQYNSQYKINEPQKTLYDKIKKHEPYEKIINHKTKYKITYDKYHYDLLLENYVLSKDGKTYTENINAKNEIDNAIKEKKYVLTFDSISRITHNKSRYELLNIYRELIT
jgi:hypothetical protein